MPFDALKRDTSVRSLREDESSYYYAIVGLYHFCRVVGMSRHSDERADGLGEFERGDRFDSYQHYLVPPLLSHGSQKGLNVNVWERHDTNHRFNVLHSHYIVL